MKTFLLVFEGFIVAVSVVTTHCRSSFGQKKCLKNAAQYLAFDIFVEPKEISRQLVIDNVQIFVIHVLEKLKFSTVDNSQLAGNSRQMNVDNPCQMCRWNSCVSMKINERLCELDSHF